MGANSQMGSLVHITAMQQQSRFASISGHKTRYYLSQLSERLRTSQAILHRRPDRAHCLIGGRVGILGPYLPLRLNRPNLGPFSENRRQAEAAQPRSRSSLPTASTPCLLCALTWKLFSVASGLPSGPPLLRPPVHKNHDGAVLICRVDMTFCPNSPLINPTTGIAGCCARAATGFSFVCPVCSYRPPRSLRLIASIVLSTESCRSCSRLRTIISAWR